jgi:uncharacterized membrane protein YkoI
MTACHYERRIGSLTSMRTLVLLLAAACPGFAEKTVTMIQEADLPAAVRAALAKDKPANATFRGFERETIDGKIFYEVQMTVAGRGREILYRPNGSIVEIEQETAIEEIPAPARDAIRKAVGEGTLRKVDIVTSGRRVVYEGELLLNGQKSQLRVDAQGRRVAQDLD